MNINNIGVPVVLAALAIIVSGMFGINIFPFLAFAAGVVLVYIIIDGIINKFTDALAKKRAAGDEVTNAKIEIMMQRMQVIENKVDKISAILEKVPE